MDKLIQRTRYRQEKVENELIQGIILLGLQNELSCILDEHSQNEIDASLGEINVICKLK